MIAFGVAVVTPPTYTAHVTLLVSPASGTGNTSTSLDAARALTPTFAELATTGPVLDRVIKSTKSDTDAGGLAQSVSTHVPVGTSLLSIGVSDRDPAHASALANAIASELSAYAPPGGSDATAALQVVLTVVDPATAPSIRDGPSLQTKVLLGGAIALFLTISIALFIENILPPSREVVRRSVPAVATSTWQASPRSDDIRGIPERADPTGRSPTTIGLDPLDSESAKPDARIASRGIINDLEVEKIRRVE